MPVFRDRSSRTEFFTLSGDDSTQIQFMRAVGKLAPSSAIVSPGPQALIDTVPGNTSTTATLTVGATPIISAVDTIADEDFYSIQLIAGHQYQIGMYGYTPQGPGDPAGPNGAPLADSYLELYNSAGVLITSADGGSDTTINSANSGFDALLTFTATTTGTYYVNARAFDNIPLDGDNGDMTGDYGLYAQDVTGDESLYTPYYSPSSPLYAIDWGTQVNKVNHTVRNPDGNEGTRDTGNAQGTPTFGSALDIPALAAAQGVDTTGKNVITIYFAKAGDIFTSNDPANPGLPPATITAVAPKDFERLAVFTSLHEFEKVADVVYLEVQDRAQADFIYTSYQGTPGPGVSLLGSMSPPDESDEGLAQFNSGDERWNARDLAQGGFSFVTLIHEFGHGHGLAHPHDNGGHSGIMNGVVAEGAGVADYTTGDYDLNQGVFTMMSYEDGWQTSPHNPHNASTTAGYGYLGGLMAFDIAAIQDKYGVNESYNTGDNTYVIKDVNAAGTFYSSIWDGGGNDSIVYAGARNAGIDLRQASLRYEQGGGGFVSYALGIYGGFTIANGVVIENAYAGSGNDTLIGNDAVNTLVGGGGNDTLIGYGGNDQMYGGSGNDSLDGGLGNDVLIGEDGNNVLIAREGNDQLHGGTSADLLFGGLGDDLYFIANSDGLVTEAANEGNDTVYTSVNYSLAAGSEVEYLSTNLHSATTAINLVGNEFANRIAGNAGANLLMGLGGADTLTGLGGDDRLYGGSGNDRLEGGSGNDVLVGDDGNDTLLAGDGNDQLHGGVGIDQMSGGLGDDLYFISDAAGVIGEAASEGNDSVYSSVSYTLAAGAEVESLSTISHAATTAIDLFGNAFANSITGNAGANVLNGGGGNDVLIGLGGPDTYQFTTALGAQNIDTIVGFQTGVDKIALDDAVFTGLGLGALSANAFVTGTAAQDADDRIIYNQLTGALLFDADGAGGADAVQFARVDPGLVLGAGDFIAF